MPARSWASGTPQARDRRRLAIALAATLVITLPLQATSVSFAAEATAGADPGPAPSGGVMRGQVLPPQQPPPGAGPHEITEAEKRLFKSDHLANVEAPKTLHYRFERRGTLQPAVDDDATLAVTIVEGKRRTEADFLHGEQRMDLPPISDVDGNPVLLHFLERELREMNRQTKGSVSYYRKRIRMALAADPPVTDIHVDYRGRQIAAQRIRVDPYLDDPARNRYPAFASRFYTLILSKDIPGEIYQLRAELLEPGKDGAPASVIQSEVLTFENEQ